MAAGEWEIRDCDAQFLMWLHSVSCSVDTLIRVVDWLKQTRENGPPKTATEGDSRDEWHAQVPMTGTVISYVRLNAARAIVITDMWSEN